MLFNSIEFAIFLPVAFLLYWFVCGRGAKSQNLLLLVASYVFYAFWDWRFLGLIAFTTLTTYASGRLIGKFQRQSPAAVAEANAEAEASSYGNPIGGVKIKAIAAQAMAVKTIAAQVAA